MTTAFVVGSPAVVLFHETAQEVLASLPDASVSLVVTDPPWNTGTLREGSNGATYSDAYSLDAYRSLIRTLLSESRRILSPEGTLAVWTDYRFAPYVAVWGDEVWGAENRVGEIVVESLLGNPGKKRWPVKHSNITVFAKTNTRQFFSHESLPEVSRRPGGSGKRGTYVYGETKKVASVLSATLSNTDAQRVGYPDQKPEWVYEALIRAYTRFGDTVVDPFAGSGTCGAACLSTGRAGVLCDASAEAVHTIVARLGMQEVA